MNSQEVESSDDVVTGNIFLNSTPVNVLFDTGASYSFVSHSLSKRLHLKPQNQELRLPIGLPTREIISCTTLFRDCVLTIEGNRFLADLIQFNLQDFDIVLGMDWFRKNHVMVDCHEKSVTIMRTDGEKILFGSNQTRKGNRIISLLKALKLLRQGCKGYLCDIGNPSESELVITNVPVVNELSDVFPENIPEMPPHREIEFPIEVVPGSTPISKAPYRMAPAELKELKEQLDELL
ncbi:uncharacterized protein LOC141614372 [Silene latifolia]|uniref:uncharacterized protein LOC141614372 n=1 Tax=Silene latifolia TaxID=37657 RepID=UPI003D76F0C0